MRDIKLDIFRGITMWYVIFIHCLYWIGLFDGDSGMLIKSFFLIEMPLFFFITGAANSFSSSKNIIKFWIKKIQRIIIPYYIYSLLGIVIVIIVRDQINLNDIIEIIISWLIPLDRQIGYSYFTYAVWFVPIYLMVIFCYPLMNRIKMFLFKINKYFVFIPLLFLVILIFILSFVSENGKDLIYYLKSVVFYSFWVYIGTFYNENLVNKSNNKVLIAVSISFLSLLCLIILNEFSTISINIQTNKFPPNFIFLIYSFCVMPFIYIFSDYIVNIVSKMMNFRSFKFIFLQYQNSSYTIFLFHPVSFIIVKKIIEISFLQNFISDNDFLGLGLYFVATSLLSALLGNLFSSIERIKLIK